jgi:CheY-like chemotaxis protein
MSLRVLIVDDDGVIVLLHKRIIMNSGLCSDPMVFSNGKTALEYLHAHVQEASRYLILLDINMPVMNGWEFLDSIKSTSLSKQVKVVVISSSINTSDREKAVQYTEVINYIEKPLKQDQLTGFSISSID